MQCHICHEDVLNNRKLKDHLESVHGITPPEYFEKHQDAEKICSKCDKTLLITNFLSDKSNTYGYRSQCIHCMRPDSSKKSCPICNRIFQWSAVVTHLKQDHGFSPEEAYEKILKEKMCPKCNTVKSLASFSKMKDPEMVYFSWCIDCNTERNIQRAFTDKDFDIVMMTITRLAFLDKCFLCEISHNNSYIKYGEPLHFDHLEPFSEGNSLSLRNVVLLCKACNLGKGTKSLEEYLKYKNNNYDINLLLNSLNEIHDWAVKEYERLAITATYKNFSREINR